MFRYHVYQLQEDGPGTEELEDEELAAANHWVLPCRDFHGIWEALVFDEEIKTRVVHSLIVLYLNIHTVA